MSVAMSAFDLTMQAIDGLSRPNETFKANEYLTHFESSSDAWTVAHQLLSIPTNQTNNYRFFGAKILYSKIQKDLSQLKSEEIHQLNQMILQCTLHLANENPIDITTTRYLCLCISALALQLDHDNIVPQILSVFNSIIQIAPTVLLELLTVLPEETFNRHIIVQHNQRDSFAKQLYESSSQVFAFLNELLHSYQNSSLHHNTNHQASIQQIKYSNQIIRCFEKWISNISITTNEILSTPLFTTILQLSTTTHYLEESIELIITANHKYNSNINNSMKYPELILSHIILFKSIWNEKLITIKSDDDDNEIFRAITRLFTESAEKFIEIMISTNFNQELLNQIFIQLLECCKFNYSMEIAKIPLKLFYDLSVIINCSDDNSSSNQLQSLFANYYTSLIYISIQHLSLSSDVLMGKSEYTIDMKDNRIDWKEAIGDAKEVLSYNICLQILCSIIQEQLQSNSINWSIIEAALSSLLVVGPTLPADEQLYMPQVLQFILSAQQLAPNITIIHITAIEFLGKVSKWIMLNPSHIHPILNILTTNLSSPLLSLAASESIMQLLRNYSPTTNTDIPIHALHSLIIELRSTSAFSLAADINILEGIAYVISTLPQNNCSEQLIALVTPIGSALTHLLQLGEIQNSLIIANIDRLTAIIRHTRVNYSTGDHPILTIFIKIQPLCEQILQRMTSESTCEKVCRFYKYSIRSIGKHFIQYLPAMLQHLVAAFHNRQYSPILYAASICVAEFGNSKGKLDELLYDMCWKLSEIFFSKFSTINAFENFPDVVEEYFHLLARYAELCPTPLLMNHQLTVLITAASTGLQLNHREATKGILHFFERLIACREAIPKELQNTYETIIESFAANLVMILFKSLLGEMPTYVFHESSGSLCDVLWKMKLHQTNNLPRWISMYLETCSLEIQDEAKKLWLPNIVTSFGKPRQLGDLLDDFHSRCKRRIPKN